ncbi:hypothetical protein ACWDLG_34215 [Nonomuraea sp. NPDC003727]
MRRALAVAAIVLAAGGCASPAWSDHDYALKAGATAEAAASSVELVRLAVAGRDKLTTPCLTILLTEAARDLGSVNDQFSAVQPPSKAADQVRAQVTGLTSAAADEVQELLIEVRRDGIEEPRRAVRNLSVLGAALRAFGQAHQ